MFEPDVSIRRTDSVENCVAASTHHLNERAEAEEERKEEQLTTVVAASTSHQQKTTKPGNGVSSTIAAPTSLGNGTGRGASTLLSNLSSASGGDSSASGKCKDSTRGEDETAVAEEKGERDSERPESHLLLSQSSMIKAERTDDASWDAKAELITGRERASKCILC